MKIKKTFNSVDLINYILKNKDKFNDKKYTFVSNNNNCVVIINSGNIKIDFFDGYNLNQDLFTIDININIYKYRFDLLDVFYREDLNPLFKREIFTDITIEELLYYFDDLFQSHLVVFYQGKIIYDYRALKDHE
ncbi:hypothetical protein BP39_06 [Staphylococcus phage BP39]|uniref:Uncharacterized protein n=1 Tax=Staphylococcus phage BP39 TaxID=1543206 RepID=A0A185AMW1_9CAUD|nr:hypothetical protein BIZ97_gp06 [Staphylococcus phage BP39]AIT13807.1 hypothetical protein BP39_06 [Staphylococcus phage BP39]